MTLTAPVRATTPPATTPGLSTPALPAGADSSMPAGRPDGTTMLGMRLILAADAMVLVSVLVAWFTIKSGAPSWPPKGVSIGTYLPTTISITAAMSAASASWMLYAVRRNDQRNAFAAAVLTVILGAAVANAQWYSITTVKFGANTHAYGTLYKVLLGYHLVQVLAGIVMLTVVAAQALAGHYGSEDHEPASAVVWFWQYANVTWVVVATVLFVLSPHATK